MQSTNSKYESPYLATCHFTFIFIHLLAFVIKLGKMISVCVSVGYVLIFPAHFNNAVYNSLD